MARLYSVFGSVKNVQPLNGTDFTLKELQQQVGGFIEIVHLSETLLMVVNEEGIAEELPVNVQATRLCEKFGLHHTAILGRALVCKDDEIK